MYFKEYIESKVRNLKENIDNKFADFPDDQRYYKGNKVRIINKDSSDKEKKLWIQKKDGSEIEVEIDQLSMSAEDSLNTQKNKPTSDVPQVPGRRGEMTEQ